MNPGTIVRCRNRDWVLASIDDEVYKLRPLTGTIDDVVIVHRGLSNLLRFSYPEEEVKPSSFPPLSAEDISDATSSFLLWHAARLTLREGAAPIRCLGRISIRPRADQLVPLLMALRLDPVRLFIADDVGVGKTIEALLIARELWERQEVKRFAVLCPPLLCDQWAEELHEKFNFEPVVIRSGTIGALERSTPHGKTLYEHFPVQVISIDWVKTDHNKHLFLQFCPELVIVDEVHGAGETSTTRGGQQERHQLLKRVAEDPKRHLILLTATPHSGVEEHFKSLLGLLKPEFRDWNISRLDEQGLSQLARHFVQRTRKDIELQLERSGESGEAGFSFPKREPYDKTYKLSESYQLLFTKTFDLCSKIVSGSKAQDKRRRRAMYWGALALLRCVMSSPASAIAAIEAKLKGEVQVEEDLEPDYSSVVIESSEDQIDDETPMHVLQAAGRELRDSEKRELREALQLAKEIYKNQEDLKVKECCKTVQELLLEGFNPIIWCRYVATAEYVGEYIRKAFDDLEGLRSVQVTVITGRLSDEERKEKFKEINVETPRVLVATDCLSEGLNLQSKFTAVLHYDLPWNPNRMEQREGRVDRYGQTAERVKAIRFYGTNNPIDGTVIEVLLNKAKTIYEQLGTYVPVPQEGASVSEAVWHALFSKLSRHVNPKSRMIQLPLFAKESKCVRWLHHRWEMDAEREKTNRTRFAQRSIKSEEVRKELEAVDRVLGDPKAVREFVLSALQRLGLEIKQKTTGSANTEVFLFSREALAKLPDSIRSAVPVTKDKYWQISFNSPTPEGADYIGRNHRFVSSLAQYLLEQALTPRGDQSQGNKNDKIVSRCGVIRTKAVNRLTTLLLLRIRYLLEIPQRPPFLSEEVLVAGYEKHLGRVIWLPEDDALRLLSQAQPSANVPIEEKRELVEMELKSIGEWLTSEKVFDLGETWGKDSFLKSEIRELILNRAESLRESHKRIHKALAQKVRDLKIKPQFPPDLLGLLLLQPSVGS